MTAKHQMRLGLKIDQRLAMLGRLRMAEWIEMPEKEFAQHIAEIEKDSLFKKLFFGSPETGSIIRRQRWPGGKMNGSFYEINDSLVAKGERVKVEEKLDERASLLPKIRLMGREAFERYFLHAEESIPLDEIARRTGISLEDAQAIHEMLLELGAEEEFYLPNREPELRRSHSCLARISVDRGEPTYEFFSPYWARGLYQIRYDLLEEFKRGQGLEPEERKRLRHFLKRIETVNLRQSTLFRILEAMTKLHADYLKSHRDDLLRPVSLRMLAHRLDLAPSTVSRALSSRSVRLPWGTEVPLHALVPGRRHVVRGIISKWLEGAEPATDAQLAQRLIKEYGIRISRRTVNAVRNELRPQDA